MPTPPGTGIPSTRGQSPSIPMPLSSSPLPSMSLGSSSEWYESSSRMAPPPPHQLGKFGRLSGFSLVTCPKCGEEVIELLSKSERNPGRIYFKCCMNEMNDPTTCKFYMFSDKYKKWLDAGCPVTPSPTITMRNQHREVQITPYEVKERLMAMEADVQALKKGLANLMEDVVVMKSSCLAVDRKLERLVNIGKLGLVCNAIVVMIVVVAVLVKLLV